MEVLVGFRCWVIYVIGVLSSTSSTNRIIFCKVLHIDVATCLSSIVHQCGYMPVKFAFTFFQSPDPGKGRDNVQIAGDVQQRALDLFANQYVSTHNLSMKGQTV